MTALLENEPPEGGPRRSWEGDTPSRPIASGGDRDDTPADGVHFGDTPADTVPADDAEPVGDSDRGAAGESADEQVPALRPLTAPADDDDEAGQPYER